MRFSVAAGDGWSQGADALIVLVSEKSKNPRLDKALSGALSALEKRGVFEGKKDQVDAVRLPRKGARRGPEVVVLAGLGKAGEVTGETLRRACGLAGRRARGEGARSLALALEGAIGKSLGAEEAARAAAEGLGLGLYRMERYKGAKAREKYRRERIARAVLCGGGASQAALRRGMRTGQILAEGTAVARDLVNTPSNEKRPPSLAAEVRRIARRAGLRCTILGDRQLRRLKMGALLAVARGSSAPARMFILEYRPRGGSAARPIAFIGKGVTFDTGGVSIKPSSGMELMTTDMSGAAAVVGAMVSVARLKPRVPVVGVGALAENMVGGDATRPGDIVRAMSGTTVEIHNTDAEGRLVLADALHYVKTRFRPQCMIDLATLTGACVVALGEKLTGLYGTHDALLDRVRRIGQETGDRVWHMPLYPEFGDMMKGKIADLCNISGARHGGANTAAAFLQHFAEGTPWVHLDIAGPAHTSKEEPYRPAGGTGVGVRLLAELARTWTSLPKQKGRAFGT
ncbi:MAG: leucyl aminopeptidase [Nitrospinota bacterium]